MNHCVYEDCSPFFFLGYDILHQPPQANRRSRRPSSRGIAISRLNDGSRNYREFSNILARICVEKLEIEDGKEV